MSALPRSDKPSVAIVTGGHPYDVPGFYTLFRSLPDANCYIQHTEDFVSDAGKVREDYDVVLFYNMPAGEPPTKAPGYEGRVRKAFRRLGKTGQGIFLLHHAILTYRDWPFWSEMVGIPDREIESYHHDEKLAIQIEDLDHPITQGLPAWDMIDETYVMAEPDAASRVLLTVNHPKSTRAIAWTRSFGGARVFCLQSGHDNQTYTDRYFREVVRRGIQWCAGKL